MKKLLFALLSVLFIVSCSKDNPETYESPYEKQFKEYGLLDNKFEDIFKVEIKDFNDSIIYFSGKLKNSSEYGLVILNKKTKEKLYDIIPFENNKVVLALGTGENHIENTTFATLQSFISNDKTVGIAVTSDATIRYIFIKNGNIAGVYDDFNCVGSNKVINWKQNFIIKDCNSTTRYLLSPTGEVITKVEFFKFSFWNDGFTPDVIVSDFEGIYEESGWVLKFDLREQGATWSKQINNNELGIPPIDDSRVIETTDTHVIYEFSYTEGSGTKKKVKVKVDIETGKMESL